jgi:hypothetical protein
MLARLSHHFAGTVIAAGCILGSAAHATPEPAMWQIKNGATTMYLFGSVHDLPPDLGWRTPAIDKIYKSADVLVFEAPLTPQSIGNVHVFVREHTTLPRGVTLTKMLSKEGLKDFKYLVARTPIDPDSINVMRPWQAQMALASADLGQENVYATRMEGVDWVLEQQAVKENKDKVNERENPTRQIRYFETAEGQIEIVSTAMPDDNIPRFEKKLHEMRTPDKDFYSHLVKNWLAGNMPAMEKSLAEERKKDPEENAIILDKRNHNWMPQIDKMLTEKHTFLVTVGAAHMTGPGSVIDMLCAEGWKVQRVKTGADEPPPACSSRGKAMKTASDTPVRP